MLIIDFCMVLFTTVLIIPNSSLSRLNTIIKLTLFSLFSGSFSYGRLGTFIGDLSSMYTRKDPVDV